MGWGGEGVLGEPVGQSRSRERRRGERGERGERDTAHMRCVCLRRPRVFALTPRAPAQAFGWADPPRLGGHF